MKTKSSRLKCFAVCAALIASIFLSYWPCVNAGFLNFDDKEYVTENIPVQHGITWNGLIWAFTSREAANWHPITWLSHMVDVRFYGLNPMGHHLTNLILHSLNSVLLFLLFQKLTGQIAPSAVIALLFAVHPCHVESVAWISERKDVLSSFFGLLAMLAYAGYVRGKKTVPTGNPRPTVSSVVSSKTYYGLSLFAYALSLMSKPMLVTLPFLLLLLDFWPLQRTSLSPFNFTHWKKLIAEKVPFLLLSGGLCVVTVFVQSKGGAVAATPILGRLENAAIAYLRYIGKLILPMNLSPYYYQTNPWEIWKVAGALILLVAVSLFFLFVSKQRPFLLIGWLWFLGTLVPVIGIIQVGAQSMADRYTYLPSIGIFVALVWAFSQSRGRFALFGLLLLAIILCSFTFLTRVQAAYWRDSETLFRHALAVTDQNFMLEFCLANALIDEGKKAEGMTHLENCRRLNPSFPNALGRLAFIAAEQGNFEKAKRLYLETLERRADFPEALNNLAWLLATCPNPQIRDGREAVQSAERACKLTANNRILFLGTLAAAYAEAGRFPEAMETADRAIKKAEIWRENSLAAKNRHLLELYQAGKPYHEVAP